MSLSDGFPPFYSGKSIPVFYDVTLVYLIFSFVALFVGVLLILPGVRGNKRWFFLFRWTISLFVGSSIIVCIYGLEWQVSIVQTYLPSRGEAESLAKYEIGLYIGLSSYNVTFKSLEKNGSNINFNEEFHFFEKETQVNTNLRRGLPTAILNIADFLSSNRAANLSLWSKRYWLAGHYASYMLWTAFAMWVVGNILLSTFVRAGGANRIVMGMLLMGANLSFSGVNVYGCCLLKLHVGYREPAIIKPMYGTSFWLCLAIGALSFCNGWIIFISDHFWPSYIELLFNIEKQDNKRKGIDSEEFSEQESLHFQANPEIIIHGTEPAENKFVETEFLKEKKAEKIELTKKDKELTSSSDSEVAKDILLQRNAEPQTIQ